MACTMSIVMATLSLKSSHLVCGYLGSKGTVRHQKGI